MLFRKETEDPRRKRFFYDQIRICFPWRISLYHGLALTGVKEVSGKRRLGAQSGWWGTKVFKKQGDVLLHQSHLKISSAIIIATYIVSDSGLNEHPDQITIMRGPEAHGKCSLNNEPKEYSSSWV